MYGNLRQREREREREREQREEKSCSTYLSVMAMKHAAAPLGTGFAIIKHVYLLHYSSITDFTQDRRNI